MTVVLDGGEEVLVEEEHVKRVQRTETVAGEWFIPHVVELALASTASFGTADHAYEESGSGEEMYVRMRLHPDVAPVDAAVLPLFEGGHGCHGQMHTAACAGRVAFWPVTTAVPSAGRYANGRTGAGLLDRGPPSLEDGTVTWRDRDTGEQTRMSVDDAVRRLAARR